MLTRGQYKNSVRNFLLKVKIFYMSLEKNTIITKNDHLGNNVEDSPTTAIRSHFQ